MNAPTIATRKLSDNTDLMHELESLRVRELHLVSDPSVQLKGIVAIHSTQLGPSLGGCRCISYESTNDAALDAMNLAHGMSYKAAIAGVPFGGGKAVLIRPQHFQDRQAYFEAFGAFIESLGGRYITAEDSGTNVTDMDNIARRTSHVSGTSAGSGDPSPHTAFGVCRGIEAAVKFKYDRDDIEDIHVAIQGVGNVGYHLARQLNQLGARLTITDLDSSAMQRCSDEFGANMVMHDAINDVDCDVFAPCALGGTIDSSSASRLKASIIAGSANNQLAAPAVMDILNNRDILYAPDYVINAGGIIQIASRDTTVLQQRLSNIYNTLMTIFERSQSSCLSTTLVAERMAERLLYPQHKTNNRSTAA